MVSKFLDSLIYVVGGASISAFTILWNRKIVTYDASWKTKPNYRKIQTFKYVIIPNDIVYEKSNDNINWYLISKEDYNNLNKKPDLNFDINKVTTTQLGLTLTNNNDSEKGMLHMVYNYI